MPRNPSELTEAIRSLLDETNGSITYSQARPRLVKMGFEISDDKPRMSSELSQVNLYEYDEEGVRAALREGDTKAARKLLAHIFDEVSFDQAAQDAILEELTVRALYIADENHFNVTKNIWKTSEFSQIQGKKSAKPSVSRKPADSKNSRARAVTKSSSAPPPKHKRRGRPRKVEVAAVQPSVEELAALEMIEKLGGVSHAEARIEELRAEAAKFEKAIELLARLSKRSEALQKRLASAA